MTEIQRKLSLVAVIALAIVTIGTAAQATLLADEPFDVVEGPIRFVGCGSGTGWEAADCWDEGSSGGLVTTGSLAYPAGTVTGPPTGNKLSNPNELNSLATRNVEASAVRTSGVVYVSFLYNPGFNPALDGSTDLSVAFGAQIASFKSEGFRILASGNYGIYHRDGGGVGSGDSGVAVVPGQTVFVVMRLDLDNTIFDLYINPGPTEPAVPDASLAGGNTDGDVGSFRLVWNTLTNPDEALDELYYGDSYADVAPGAAPVPGITETGALALALLALALLTVMAIRRRRAA